MQVKNLMTVNPKTVSPKDDIVVVFNDFTDNKIRQAPVIENGKLIGIITDRDLRMALVTDKPKMGLNVENVMTKDPVAVCEDTSIKDAAGIIIEKKYNAIPVVDNENHLKGILTTTDIIKCFIDLAD